MQRWYWSIDQVSSQLSLHMNGVVLPLVYTKKHLKDNIPKKEKFVFTLEECALFNEVSDYLYEYGIYDANEQLELAAHAVAAITFGKALMPQSWHFQLSTLEQWPDEHKFCSLNSGFSKGTFLVIEADEQTALCMFTDEQIEVSPAKKMKRFELIRVLKDRLQSHGYHPIKAIDSFQKLA